MKNDYDTYWGNHGFSFRYKNGHISKSKPIDPNDRYSLEGNSDNLFVLCGNCDEWMEFTEGSGSMDGYWQCSCCGAKVREVTAYNQLNRENDSNPYSEYFS